MYSTYSILHEPDTSAFLDEYPFLVPLFSAAGDSLIRAFPGSNITTRVDDTVDPDTGKADHQRPVTVWIGGDPHDAVDCLYRFYDDWWLDNFDAARGKLRFDVGFE
jgi:hypothetical protein